jgi:hypothetical protein
MKRKPLILLTKGSVARKIEEPAFTRLRKGTSEMERADYKNRFRIAKYTSKWAVTMTKVCIRHSVAQAPWPRWHFVDFCGPHGAESRGVVDLIAIRKDHGPPRVGTKRGDALQVILIQVKGGYAAKPTSEDGQRLRAVARRHGACRVLLATWKKEGQRDFSLCAQRRMAEWKIGSR